MLLLKRVLRSIQLEHDSVGHEITPSNIVVQVGYLGHAECCRNSDPSLLAVWCPYDLRYWRSELFYVCFKCCYFVYLSKLLLIISGDVEENASPQPTDSTQPANIVVALRRIESEQADLLAKVTSLQNGQKSIEANERKFIG